MCAYQVFHWLCVLYLSIGYYSVNTIVLSSLPSNAAVHATASSAPDPKVWFQYLFCATVSCLWTYRYRLAFFSSAYAFFIGF